MVPVNSPSEVREFVRHHCRINARFSVAPGNAEKLAFSRHAGDGSGFIPGVLVDCSHGGFAVETDVFVPRSARLRAMVPIPGEAPLEFDVVVRRAAMTSRKPVYNLGMSVVEPVASQEPAIQRLLALAKSQGLAAPAGPTDRTPGGTAVA